jgi:3-deoxy-D-manno-octulosonic-acid transferase
MHLIYLGLVKTAELLLFLLSPFLRKGKTGDFIRGRQLPYPPLTPKTSTRYWFHCASLGEFEQARPVIEKLKSDNASASIVITFFSPSGYQQKHGYPIADAVIYLPLDTPGKAKKLLDYLQPDVAIFVKYEIWYFHLTALFKRSIPVYLISATLRPGQFLFSFWGRWLFKLLPQYEQIFLQDNMSYELLKEKQLDNIMLAGDTRYDRVKQNALQVKQNDYLRRFKGDKKLLILGSSWPAEEDILLDFLQNNAHSELKIIIAPHDISAAHIHDIDKKFANYHPVKFTELSADDDTRVMILNTIGHLASTYFYADLAFVGGAFGKGLHNILEPLAFGAPVIFGPNFSKYPEASLAMEGEVAISIHDAEGFTQALDTLSDTGRMVKCIDFINWHSGATDKVVKKIKEFKTVR